MPSNARASAPPSATSPASLAQPSVPMAGSPTKASAVCFNISTAIVASGLERRRNFSEETDDDYTDNVVGRPSCERPPYSTIVVAALGLAVLAAVVIAIALAIPNLTDIGTIYATVT